MNGLEKLRTLVEDQAKSSDRVRLASVASLPSRFGEFYIVAFENTLDHKEHIAIVSGEVVGKSSVLTRLHSECLTGDVMGSLRCDCQDQLQVALKRIDRNEAGVVLYLRQEGRGIGLTNKIKAYRLQEDGYDTVDANRALGFADDERDYEVAAAMLKAMGIQSVRLMTNNPEKIDQLQKHGVTVSERVPHVIAANEHNRHYLETKASRSGHLIDTEVEHQIDPLFATS